MPDSSDLARPNEWAIGKRGPNRGATFVYRLLKRRLPPVPKGAEVLINSFHDTVHACIACSTIAKRCRHELVCERCGARGRCGARDVLRTCTYARPDVENETSCASLPSGTPSSVCIDKLAVVSQASPAATQCLQKTPSSPRGHVHPWTSVPSSAESMTW